MKGYIGKILYVDLGNRSIDEIVVKDEIYENYLSGSGLAAWFLYKNIPPNSDALGPDNILGFVSGLLTGTGSVMTGRWLAVCKSPLTGGWGDANCGGTFSPAIKQCGWDGIFFRGISDKPVYLYADNKTAELRDATDLWGLDAVESEKILIEKNWNKKKPEAVVIGQSAERLSLISGILNDGGRIAARSGVGAVMGSKRLKGVVLAGSKPIKAHNKDEIQKLSREFSNKIRKQNLGKLIPSTLLPTVGKLQGNAKKVGALDGMVSAGFFKQWGTGFSNLFSVANGDSPIKNWKGSVVDFSRDFYKHINPDKAVKREIQKYHCYSCVVGCGGICNIGDLGDGEFSQTHKPEYETVCAFSGLIMNKDYESVLYINELLNRAGMDTISAGTCVAYAIECYEKGVITSKDTDGLELNWGNTEAIVTLVKKMIKREGIGDILADGVKIASERLGQGSENFAIHAGGQEPGMHDPRLDPLMGVHYSVEQTPGRHTIGSATYYNSLHLWTEISWLPKLKKYPKNDEYKASDSNALKTSAMSCFKQVLDGAGGCLFTYVFGLQHWKIFKWLNAATGWAKTPDEYMEIGRRIQTLRQMFNIREGIKPIDYKIKDRIAGVPPLSEGPVAQRTVPIEGMMKKHWEKMGWDSQTGIPTEETIKGLNIVNIAGKTNGK